MKKHFRFDTIRPRLTHDPDLRREQMAIISGYVMALEDILVDFQKFQETIPTMPGLTDPHKVMFRFQNIILKVRRRALMTKQVMANQMEVSP